MSAVGRWRIFDERNCLNGRWDQAGARTRANRRYPRTAEVGLVSLTFVASHRPVRSKQLVQFSSHDTDPFAMKRTGTLPSTHADEPQRFLVPLPIVTGLARCLQTDPHGCRTDLGMVAQRNALLLAVEKVLPESTLRFVGRHFEV
jgi:hypothetical protein